MGVAALTSGAHNSWFNEPAHATSKLVTLDNGHVQFYLSTQKIYWLTSHINIKNSSSLW